EQLSKDSLVAAGKGGAALSKDALDSGFAVFRRSFDTRKGGFGGAPKFPRPVVLNFLLRYHARSKNAEALAMVLQTLREMAKGGMNDQLGGGFHRYSVDGNWFVPHFEKMLYDQAQLAISYLEAYQITGEAFFGITARQIFDYVLRDMTDAEGGFYSAEDADSVIDPANPKEKGEGAFYIWKQSEIEGLLDETAARHFKYCYGVEPSGNVKEDPHHEFTGRNILFEAHSIAETAAHFEKQEGVPYLDSVSSARMFSSLKASSAKLLAERAKRVRPHLDDKVLTAWNGMMISAFAKGGAILNEPRYATAARSAADFIATRMYDAKGNILLRRYRQGDAAIPGFLDDYAMFVQGLLDLYEAQFHLPDFELAIKLTARQRELFEDKENGGFYSSAAGDASLVMRMKEDYDGAEPSANSVTALNLLRLGQMTGRDDLRQSAERLLQAFASRVMGAPVTVPQLLVAFDFSLSKPKQVILVGERGAALDRLLTELQSRFLPNHIALLIDGEPARKMLSGYLGVVETMTAIGGKPTAYVCENYACQLPVSDAEKFAGLLQ
ncbi:MAG: thioredoxin domain-containing protein, partial [Bryobacteraceae bacterium]